MLARKIVKDTDGQVLVLFALVMLVLMGFAALATDVGMAYNQKTNLQSAADAAALAGAMKLPNTGDAMSVAVSYAGKNGLKATENGVKKDGDTVTATVPYNGNSDTIEVVCTRTVKYSFASALGFTEKDVSARAVAQKQSQWAGEALPFINLDDDYQTDPEIVAWEKVTPGDFESIDNYEIINPGDPDKLYFMVDYLNGVELKKGTVATIKQEVGYVYDQHKPDKPVYVLSLSRDVINSGSVKLKDGTMRSLSKLKNNDVVDPSQLVLLECIFHDYDYQGKTLFLTCLDVYDIAQNEFPPDYVSPNGGTSKLLE